MVKKSAEKKQTKKKVSFIPHKPEVFKKILNDIAKKAAEWKDIAAKLKINIKKEEFETLINGIKELATFYTTLYKSAPKRKNVVNARLQTEAATAFLPPNEKILVDGLYLTTTSIWQKSVDDYIKTHELEVDDYIILDEKLLTLFCSKYSCFDEEGFYFDGESWLISKSKFMTVINNFLFPFPIEPLSKQMEKVLKEESEMEKKKIESFDEFILRMNVLKNKVNSIRDIFHPKSKKTDYSFLPPGVKEFDGERAKLKTLEKHYERVWEKIFGEKKGHDISTVIPVDAVVAKLFGLEKLGFPKNENYFFATSQVITSIFCLYLSIKQLQNKNDKTKYILNDDLKQTFKTYLKDLDPNQFLMTDIQKILSLMKKGYKGGNIWQRRFCKKEIT